MGLKGMKEAGIDILILIVSSIVLVLFGLVFFLISLWIVKFTSIDILQINASGDWIVVSAAILTAAAMIGSIHKRL
jgi:hypothetical protein